MWSLGRRTLERRMSRRSQLCEDVVAEFRSILGLLDPEGEKVVGLDSGCHHSQPSLQARGARQAAIAAGNPGSVPSQSPYLYFPLRDRRADPHDPRGRSMCAAISYRVMARWHGRGDLRKVAPRNGVTLDLLPMQGRMNWRQTRATPLATQRIHGVGTHSSGRPAMTACEFGRSPTRWAIADNRRPTIDSMLLTSSTRFR